MRRSLRVFVGVLALAGLTIAVAACGSGNKSSSSSAASTGAQPTSGGKQGGTLTLVSSGDVDNNLDPGYSYYQFDFVLDNALHRTLFTYKPDDTTQPSPDLAAAPAQISDGGKTVTVKIKTGVKFSPPVNRAVTSADVKYAMERDFNPAVGNGYAGAYWGDIIGSKPYAAGKAKEISGIQTPDPQTLVIHLARPTAAIVIGAMALPGTAPVPQDYAAKFDKGAHSTYGQHLVTTGPYMVQNNASGKITGYQPGHNITIVRNPNWDKSTDFRPAYVDKIIVNEGNDITVGNRKILTGQSMIGNQADLQAPPAVLKQASTQYKSQFIPGGFTGRFRYIALNTTVKPFDNINVRKAVIANMDKNALRLAFGGPLIGAIPTHFLSPGIVGFDQAGGLQGPDLDFMHTDNGDPALAASYMKKAGYPSGKYTGGETVLMVTDSAAAQKKVAEVAQQSMQSLGFHVSLRAVERSTMYSKFCSVPKAKVAVCPSVGWLKDFADAQTVLDPTFNGKNIIPSNNSNWPQLNDPAINKAMDSAETILDPAKRAEAWGKIDDMVTAAAPGVLWLWDKGPSIMSKNVNGVLNKENASWDLSFTSLK
jgi:peptide/nickel transport system substrate-binding protein